MKSYEKVREEVIKFAVKFPNGYAILHYMCAIEPAISLCVAFDMLEDMAFELKNDYGVTLI